MHLGFVTRNSYFLVSVGGGKFAEGRGSSSPRGRDGGWSLKRLKTTRFIDRDTQLVHPRIGLRGGGLRRDGNLLPDEGGMEGGAYNG